MSVIYKAIISVLDKFVPAKLRPLWEHPAGPKTVFFWAPAFKWGLVLAGISDLNRHPKYLSFSQNTVLTLTGFIWARYSLVITPVNYSLFSVNLFLGIVQLRQTIRIILYQMEQKKLLEEEEMKKADKKPK